MHRPAMFQITNHCDGEPIHSANLLSDREDIQKCLSRMLTDAISCIDQRLAAVVRCPLQHKCDNTVQSFIFNIYHLRHNGKHMHHPFKD
jgi:hypothetical protein